MYGTGYQQQTPQKKTKTTYRMKTLLYTNMIQSSYLFTQHGLLLDPCSQEEHLSAASALLQDEG